MNAPWHLSPEQTAGLGLPPVRRPESAPMIQVPQPGCGADRVHLAGGALNSLLVNPEVVPWEQLYRRLPDPGMFDEGTSSQRPFVCELGAFQVPSTFCLAIFDLRPDIYRFSGVDSGDAVPVEARRFSSSMGFQVTVNQVAPANVYYELQPVPVQTFQQAFQKPQVLPPGTAAAIAAQSTQAQLARFNLAAANSYATATGAGTALQPQRPTRYGALSAPFTLFVWANQTFQVRCVVWEPLASPIAFIEYDVAGFLMPEVYARSLIECMKPLTNASGGPGSMGGGPR